MGVGSQACLCKVGWRGLPSIGGTGDSCCAGEPALVLKPHNCATPWCQVNATWPPSPKQSGRRDFLLSSPSHGGPGPKTCSAFRIIMVSLEAAASLLSSELVDPSGSGAAVPTHRPWQALRG